MLPAPELPKGGGALRSINEAFAAHPALGTGSMSIPVPLPAGRSGHTPELSLTYDSGQGNGAVGIGWALGAALITRRTDGGLPTYSDDDESDIFVWAGAEDLVPFPTTNGAPAETTVYPDYVVHRYRPRVDSNTTARSAG